LDPLEIDELANRLLSGDVRALAKALTLVENRAEEVEGLVSRLFSRERTATVVGLTGPPGVGKSTLGDSLATKARERGRSVAVLAIDPTSPLTGGALLGDRARMDSVSRDPSIFVRSMATRGHVGGLSSAAFEALVLLEASGRDFILVETVGAGQDEVEVASAVSVTVLVLAPGLGDEIQAAKAGILEVADVLVVNKSDRDGAEGLYSDLSSVAAKRPLLRTMALTGEGVEALYQAVVAAPPKSDRRFVEVWLWDVIQTRVRERIPDEAWRKQLERLGRRELTPYQAAMELLEET
jgi:LAO/AO transport system kinase